METIEAVTEFAEAIEATEAAATAAASIEEAVLSALESRLITDLRGMAPP